VAIRRLAVLAPLVVVPAFFASFAIAGEPADTKDGAVIAAFYSDNRTRLLATAWIAGLAIAGLLVWVWILRPVFASTPTDLWTAIFASAAALVGVELGTVAASQTLAYVSTDPVAPDVARAFYELSLTFSYTSAFASAVFTAFVAWAILKRTTLLPTWLGWWAALLTVLALPGSARGLELDVLVGGMTMLWVLTMSIVSFRRLGGGALGG
jgi:hypothetical protein